MGDDLEDAAAAAPGNDSAGWRFWRKWLIASVAGWILGGAFGISGISVALAIAFVVIYGLDPSRSEEAFTSHFFRSGFALSIGAGVGVAQWLVLRQRVSRAGWWIPARAVGYTLSTVFVSVAAYVTGWPPIVILAFLVTVLALAGVQWLFLGRRAASHARLKIPVRSLVASSVVEYALTAFLLARWR